MSSFDRLFRTTKPVTILRSGLTPATVMPVVPVPIPSGLMVSEPKTRRPYRVPPELRRALQDADGQPNPPFNAWRRNDRAIHELLGLAKGILADGVVMPAEVIELSRWILANAEPDSGWPIDVESALKKQGASFASPAFLIRNGTLFTIPRTSSENR